MNRAAEIIDESRYYFALIVITFAVAAGDIGRGIDCRTLLAQA